MAGPRKNTAPEEVAGPEKIDPEKIDLQNALLMGRSAEFWNGLRFWRVEQLGGPVTTSVLEQSQNGLGTILGAVPWGFG